MTGGRPTFLVAASGFLELARACAEQQAIPGSRIVVYPGPLKGALDPDVEAWITSLVEQVLARL
ncbi:MAG TPA: hypothetical protein PLW10_06315 [Myxococcota bacterium]|nr:hypothetical protein [Myxococcales bacterium]HPG25227.1 hypothetical protein [Myxococcota bacterium]